MKGIGRNKKALKIAVVLAAFLLTATILTAVTTTTNQNQNQNMYPLISLYLQSVSQGSSPVISEKQIYIWTNTNLVDDVYEPIIVNGSNIVINGNGHTVQGTGSGYGFNLTDVSNVTIKNVVVTGWSFGFYLNNSVNNTLTGNMANTNTNGFYLENSSYNNLKGNTANYNSYYGFGLVNSTYNNISGNNASYGVSPGSSGGFCLTNSSYNIFTNNTANNHSYFGFQMSTGSNNNIFSGNTANNNTWYGFLVEPPSCYNNTFTGNTANNTGDFTAHDKGIGFFIRTDCHNNTLTGNTANNNAYRGIRLYQSSNNTLTDNTANNNYYDGFYLNPDSNNNTLTGNTANNNYRGFRLYSCNNNNLSGNTANNNTDAGFYINASSYNNLSGNTAANNGYGFRLNASSTYNNLLGNVAINSTTGGYNWTIDCIDNDFMGSVEANYLRVYVNVSSGLPLRGVQVQVVSNGTVWYATPGFGGSGSPTGTDGYTPWFAVPYRTFTGNDTMSENNNTVTVKYSTLWKIAKFSNNPLTEVNMSTQHTEYFTVASWQPTLLQTMLPLMLFSLAPRGITPIIYATVGIAAIAIVAAAALTYHYRHKIFK